MLDWCASLPAAPEPPADRDRLSYTSGSTGTSQGRDVPDWLAARLRGQYSPAGDNPPVIGIDYVPLSHIYGREMAIGTIMQGGASYFVANSDMSTLFEDIALVRLTELQLVPRICDMICQRFLSEADASATHSDSRAAIENDVKTDLRERFLGCRIARAGCGSAPLSAELRTFQSAENTAAGSSRRAPGPARWR
ncbi:AMP-binding protein [Kribbella speibonae]|uniref:AMP-dependent synthetase/ligase domain-containing protein n=1 Tax=Kribbella speibonae TaxID=1572660 RepID=A0A4R0IXM4_9ACTN|nr:AMP-binding protein [Kribbella speibonae]TCC36436.1 hypothetical protein E0H92_27785 [Kribbella speibonae]